MVQFLNSIGHHKCIANDGLVLCDLATIINNIGSVVLFILIIRILVRSRSYIGAPL